MKLPVSWLREFVDVPVEPRQLGEDLTFVGLAMDGLESDGKDAVLDLDVTTNRVDCMNVYGVAREVSVIYGVPLKPLPLDVAETGAPAQEALDVTIEAADLCPRFCARVLDARLGPSPAWLRDRLEQVGVRAINNVVDLTNYVMLEMGQPSHAFDLAKVPGAHLLVRWGRPGEKLTTLDGVERSIGAQPRIGLVACPAGPLAIAGVMGGASSEVSDETRTIALEAAFWEPLAIRRAARALGMHTEASHRFERGADPEGTWKATARIAHLLAKIGAGSARPGLIDRVASPRPKRSAPLRAARASAVLGADVPPARAETILCGLGFAVEKRNGDALQLTIPSWRSDVARETDLIEEIGRHHGLDMIAPTLPETREAGGLKRWQSRERRLRQTLVAAGLTETITLSFIGSKDVQRLEPVGAEPRELLTLANPLSEEQGVLRPSLAPGLLKALETNARHGRRGVRAFEIGRSFAPAPTLAREARSVGIVLSGPLAGHWSEKPRSADFFDLKGLVQAIADAVAGEPFAFSREGAPGHLHPGRCASVSWRGRRIGWLGELHPELHRRFELRDPAFLAEIEVEELLQHDAPAARFAALPRFPAVERDLSLLCADDVTAAELLAKVQAAAGPLLQSVAVADRYEGAPIPKGKVSLMLKLRYQDPARTLTSDEVEASVAEAIRTLKTAGAEIRGE
jgi:phenylalanyl-tRNA synthetase beta chain